MFNGYRHSKCILLNLLRFHVTKKTLDIFTIRLITFEFIFTCSKIKVLHLCTFTFFINMQNIVVES